jgi:excisionase family DNA binding protein
MVAMPVLYTVKEAAAAIHPSVSTNTVYAAIRSGALAAMKIGARYYVHEEEVRRFISCPDQENRPASSNGRTMGRGSSSTAVGKSGLAMVTDFVMKQKLS